MNQGRTYSDWRRLNMRDELIKKELEIKRSRRKALFERDVVFIYGSIIIGALGIGFGLAVVMIQLGIKMGWINP